MSAYRLPEMKPVNRSAGGDGSVELARAWGEMNYGAPNKKKGKSSLEDGSEMDYNFLAASSLAAWMNVASLMNDDQGEDDEDGRPRLRIAGHLVSEDTDNRPVREPQQEPNTALLNVTKALSKGMASDGADDALTKAWLAAAATNSGDSLTEEQIQFLLAKRNQPVEDEQEIPPPATRAAAEAQALVGASVAAASSSAAVSAPQPPAEDPAEQTERAITASIADSVRQQKEASQRSSRVAASIAAFAASAAQTAASATNAEKKRTAERRKLQQAAAEKAKKDAPIPPVEEKVETLTQEELHGDVNSDLHSFALSAKGPKKAQPGMPEDSRQKVEDARGLVYLGYLPKGAGASEVQEALEQFGRVASIDVSASSRWALAKFADLNDSFKAVGRLSRQGELFGARIEVRLGTAKDLARARGEPVDDDEMYDPEAPTDGDRRGRNDDGDRRDRVDSYDNRRRDDDEDEYGRSKNRPQRRRDDSRDRREDMSRGRDRAEPYPPDKAMDAKTKTTETFRELFQAERSKVQKKLAKGAVNHSSAKKEDDYEYYSYSDDDRAPRNPRGKVARPAQRKGQGKAKASDPAARTRIPPNLKLLGPEPEYSYYSDSDIDDDGNVVRQSAPAVKAATRSDDPSGARQVRVRGGWSEYLLPDNRTYWVNIQTGEKTWSRPAAFDSSSRSGAAHARSRSR